MLVIKIVDYTHKIDGDDTSHASVLNGDCYYMFIKKTDDNENDSSAHLK